MAPPHATPSRRREPVAFRLRQADIISQSGMPLFILFVHHELDVKFHTHDFVELVIVLDGCGRHIMTHGQYAITAGDVFVIPERVGHAYRDIRHLKLVNVLFDLRTMAPPLRDLLPPDGYRTLFVLEPRLRSAGGAHHFCRLSASALSRVQELLTNAQQELDRKPPGYKCLALGLFLQAVGFVGRYYSQMRAPTPRALLRLGRTLDFLENHYTESLTLDQLARIANMSPSTLYRAFQRSFQTSPIDYLIRYRIQKAIELFTGDDLTITEIALQVGFNDSNYFSRQFRQHLGIAPSQYWKTHRNRPAQTH